MSDTERLDPRTNHRVCPNCQSDVLDGQGPFTREIRTMRLENDGVNQRLESWYQMHCPDCGEVFAVRERVITEKVDTDT